MDLKSLIRNIPDFPKPGILFRDITTLLQDPQGLRYTIDCLTNSAVALAVPPVAIKSSTIKTLSPDERASWCISKQSVPYSNS